MEVLWYGIEPMVGGSLQAPSCTHQPASDNIHHQHKALHPLHIAPPQYSRTRAGWLAGWLYPTP